MKKKFTLSRSALVLSALLFFLAIFSFTKPVRAQTSLVLWEMAGSAGPTATPTTSLAINNGKLVSAVGQTSAAFVSSAGEPTDPIFLCNGWNVGSGSAWFLVNFSTTNFSGIAFKFILGTYQFGPKNFKTQYSISSASGAWTDFGSAINYGSSGGSSSYNFSLPAACDNKTNVWVRVVTTSAPSSTGGCFIDNVEVTGSAGSPPIINTHPANATVCPTDPVSFAVTATNAISYQWEYNTGSGWVNVPSSFPYSDETTATLDISSVTVAMNGYQFRCVVSGAPPAATSNPATLTVTSYGTWTGLASTLWSNTGNWSCNQLPTSTTNVVISPTANQPVVDIPGAVCNNLTINNGASLSFNGTTNVLDVKGTITGPGSLNATLGKLVLSGIGAQSFPGTSYKDIQMNGVGDKTPSGAVTVNGILTLTSGNVLLVNNNLTIGATGSISGGNPFSFIVENGTGALTQQNLGTGGRTGNILFPTGALTSSYTPVGLANAGTSDAFTVKVSTGVYANYTGSVGQGAALTANAVNKTWNITEGLAGGSNATVTLQWNGVDELAGFDRNNCNLGHYTGGAWDMSTSGGAVGFDPYLRSRTSITDFSPFGIGSAGSPLPLELTSFNGKLVENAIRLNWVMANGQNVTGFELERSVNGVDFSTVAQVSADGRSAYEYNDQPEPLSSIIYYRLRINYNTLSFKYSGIIHFDLTSLNHHLFIYPNPVTGSELKLRLGDGLHAGTMLNVVDGSGKKIISTTISSEDLKKFSVLISLKTLAAGNYFLSVHDPVTNEKESIPFIKQ